MYHACRHVAAWTAFVSLLVLAGEAAQTPRPAPDSRSSATIGRFSPSKTPWGDPDLQGIWPSGQLIDVPFERPEAFGTRAELNDGELAERSAQVRAQVENDRAESGPSSGSPPTGPPPHWAERGIASRQTSLIVDPPDGRLPRLTEDGARRADRWRTTAADNYVFTGPEDLTPYDRCITRGVLGSTFPNIYNTGMQITQTPGAVVISYEMVHETRIIPLDGRPHAGPALRSYMGDPRGRWEGSALVVETTNFNGRTGSYGRNGNGNPTTDALRLVERFTLADANTLEYQVTVTDPLTWVRPWTVRFPIVRDDGYAMLEYACHEGNYAMTNSLKGARAKDR
jgi:hypothetical protein